MFALNLLHWSYMIIILTKNTISTIILFPSNVVIRKGNLYGHRDLSSMIGVAAFREYEDQYDNPGSWDEALQCALIL